MNLENMDVAVQVFITGFIVVFAILILLIAVIKLYSTIIYNSTLKAEEKAKQAKAEAVKTVVDTNPQPSLANQNVQEVAKTDSQEIIAVISAAVYSMYGEENVVIKSIKKAPKVRSAWSMAGLSDNTRPF